MKRDYNYIQGNDLDGTFEYEQLLNEVGEEWNDQFHPNPVPTAHLVLHLLDTLTQDQQWSPDKRLAAVLAVQEACAAKIHTDTEQNLTRLGEINQLAFDMVKPHLDIAGPSVEKNMPTFTAALSAYLEAPDDPTGLRLSNLRLMAETLQRNLTLISGLLTQIETRPKTS